MGFCLIEFWTILKLVKFRRIELLTKEGTSIIVFMPIFWTDLAPLRWSDEGDPWGFDIYNDEWVILIRRAAVVFIRRSAILISKHDYAPGSASFLWAFVCHSGVGIEPTWMGEEYLVSQVFFSVYPSLLCLWVNCRRW